MGGMIAGADSAAGVALGPYHQWYSRSASPAATGTGTPRLVTPNACDHSAWS